jgi:hypothetical protein
MDDGHNDLLISEDVTQESRRDAKFTPPLSAAGWAAIWMHATVTHLLIQTRMCRAQPIRGDLEQAVERPIHLQYEEYRATNRQCTNEEDRDDHGVPRCKQPEARDCEHEPEQEDRKEGE